MRRPPLEAKGAAQDIDIWRRWPALVAILLALVTALATACGGQEKAVSGSPRSFEMGFSSLPGQGTEDAYVDTFKLAGENGEIILLQRAPPWDEFRPGAEVAAETLRLTSQEKSLAEENGLQIFVAVDPLDAADRARLAGLPEDLAGAGFDNPDVRAALTSYAKYLALNLKPRYMALGVEVDLYYDARPEDFPNFVSLYFEAYDAVKDLSPETLVFPTFQLENMEDRLSPKAEPVTRWHLVQQFEPKLDVLAVSTFPSFVFATPDDIPRDYYSHLGLLLDRPIPIGIASMGYSSGASRDDLNQGTEEEQESFVRRVLEDAEGMGMIFVIWFASGDPSFATDPPFDLLRHIGLLRADGSEKPAWKVWAQAADRPLARGP